MNLIFHYTILTYYFVIVLCAAPQWILKSINQMWFVSPFQLQFIRFNKYCIILNTHFFLYIDAHFQRLKSNYSIY